MTDLHHERHVVSATGAHRQDVLRRRRAHRRRARTGTDALGRPSRARRRSIDATGKYVIPGGIDAHTHMELPFGGTFASDTFETGTLAAAFGGTTTIIDFAVQRTGEQVQDGLDAWHDKAEGSARSTTAFHLIIGGVDDDSLKAMDDLVDEGITSFKLFMAYPGVFYSDDGQILRAMQTRGRPTARMIMMHAENGIAIDVLVAQALARGETAPKYHGTDAAVGDRRGGDPPGDHAGAGSPARPLYIVHMSAKQAVATRRRARDEGRNVFGETCPQYLYLSARGAPRRRRASRAPSTCARRRCGRTPRATRTTCGGTCAPTTSRWSSTDHCPFCIKEQKELGVDDFSKIPNGIGGVEHRMDLIYQGVVDGELASGALGRAVRDHAGAHVRPVPAKGVIAAGLRRRRRASTTPTARRRSASTRHHMNMDYSA